MARVLLMKGAAKLLLSIFVDMFEVFKLYLNSKLRLSEKQFEELVPFISSKTLARGEILLRAGEVCRHTTFVQQGCLRSFVTDLKGKEHTINFAPENWWLADQNSLRYKVPAMFSIEAVEESDVLLLPADIIDILERIAPGAMQMFGVLNQNNMIAMQKRLINHLSATADERYLDFIETYPSLALRVPQKMIASFIGVAPESLSRIRGQIGVRRG